MVQRVDTRRMLFSVGIGGARLSWYHGMRLQMLIESASPLYGRRGCRFFEFHKGLNNKYMLELECESTSSSDKRKEGNM
jgi:hypothetical protein